MTSPVADDVVFEVNRRLDRFDDHVPAQSCSWLKGHNLKRPSWLEGFAGVVIYLDPLGAQCIPYRLEVTVGALHLFHRAPSIGMDHSASQAP